MAILLILTGKHEGKRLSLPDGEVLIGRDSTCQIRLATDEVSRQHCRLRCEDGEVFVTDLSSRNGTLINDHAITVETPLLPGDKLRVGPISFQLIGQKSSEQPASKKPSDDSILNWLSEESAGSLNDTTIIRKSADSPSKSEPPPVASAAANSQTPLPPTKKFKSVGEEGEDIIQRHYDLIQSGKFPKRCPALRK